MSQGIALLEVARSYVAAGLSVIPIHSDGSKRPDPRVLPREWDHEDRKDKTVWKPFQERQPTDAELKHWFGSADVLSGRTVRGIGIVCGRVSKNLYVFDFDAIGVFDEWLSVCEDHDLAERIQGAAVVTTPSGGKHLTVRCTEPVPGNTKLAFSADMRSSGGKKPEIKIETRGDGGMVVAPPSPASIHPDNRPYVLERGSYDSIPVLSPEEIIGLSRMAMIFNEYVEKERIIGATPPRREGCSLRPGQDYNERGDYEKVLEEAGWRQTGHRGGVGLWCRPDKPGRCVSATTNYKDSRQFYVFSSNAHPFEAEKSYTPFGTYAMIHHNGDFKEAARALGDRGYGDQKPRLAPSPPTNKLPDTAAVPVVKTETVQVAAPKVVHDAVRLPQEAWEAPIALHTAVRSPFPVDALPPTIASYCKDVAQSIEVPIDATSMMALSVGSVAAARRFDVLVGADYIQPTCLWVIVQMASGELKSETLKRLAFPLYEEEERLGILAKPEIKLATSRAKIQEKSITAQEAKLPNLTAGTDAYDKAKKELEAMLLDPVVIPPMPTLLAMDATPERLARMVSEDPAHCMGILSAEAGIVSTLTGMRYTGNKGQGSSNIDMLLSGHDAERYRIDRQIGDSIIIYPRLSLGWLVQPKIVEMMAKNEEFVHRGLLARFLFSDPISLVGDRTGEGLPQSPDIREAYENTILWMLRLPVAQGHGLNGKRHQMRLEGEAQQVWQQYKQQVEKRLKETEDMSGMREWASKLAGRVARIAAIMTLWERVGSDQPWRHPISVEVVERSWAIGAYMITHAKLAHHQMNDDPTTALARKIIEWIKRKKWEAHKFPLGAGIFNANQCYRDFQSYKTTDVADALELLAEHWYVQPREVQQPGPGRKRSQTYEAHPDLLGSVVKITNLSLF